MEFYVADDKVVGHFILKAAKSIAAWCADGNLCENDSPKLLFLIWMYPAANMFLQTGEMGKKRNAFISIQYEMQPSKRSYWRIKMFFFCLKTRTGV
jgi:hypothetical protein